MEKNNDIAALGELLIDFTEAGTGADGMRLFEQNPDGCQPYGLSDRIYRKSWKRYAWCIFEKDSGKRKYWCF